MQALERTRSVVAVSELSHRLNAEAESEEMGSDIVDVYDVHTGDANIYPTRKLSMRPFFITLSTLMLLAFSSTALGQDAPLQLDEPMPSNGAVIGASIGGTFAGLAVGAALSVGVIFVVAESTNSVNAFEAVVFGSISVAPVFGALGAWIGARLVGADVRYDHALAGGMLGAGVGAGLMGLTFLSDNERLGIAGLLAPPIFLVIGTVVGAHLSHRRRSGRSMMPTTNFDQNGGTVGLAGMF